MTTPILKFLSEYAASSPTRLHMPGHKGQGPLGVEKFDITEVPGADVLYGAEGIIRESEANASRLFGTAATLYSTEGSSLCIRAMLALVSAYARERGQTPHILAARGAHSTFLTALGLLDVGVTWLSPSGSHLLSCPLTAELLSRTLDGMEVLPTAVYITSPDYPGNLLPISDLAEVCHSRGVLLLVDNAHGAYLRFLPRDLHPISLGADLCCDSAHKTLPALTGTAYLHISPSAPALFLEQAESAMALFASTSPSYLLLASLDSLNPRLEREFPQALATFVPKLAALKGRLEEKGIPTVGNEPLKLTLHTTPWGYTGEELADLLRQSGIHSEFSDPTLLTLMFSPYHPEALETVGNALLALPRGTTRPPEPPTMPLPPVVMGVREALLSPKERLPLEACVGRVLASPALSCPPAVSPIVCGERITPEAIPLLSFYGHTHLWVVK